MRIVWAALLMTILPVAAAAMPRMPQAAREDGQLAPRLFTGQLAEALAEAGCMPGVQGQWAFDVRAHIPAHWQPEPPPADIVSCVTKVLPLFPSDITGAILIWPFP